jgi:hypothetical protein
MDRSLTPLTQSAATDQIDMNDVAQCGLSILEDIFAM